MKGNVLHNDQGSKFRNGATKWVLMAMIRVNQSLITTVYNDKRGKWWQWWTAVNQVKTRETFPGESYCSVPNWAAFILFGTDLAWQNWSWVRLFRQYLEYSFSFLKDPDGTLMFYYFLDSPCDFYQFPDSSCLFHQLLGITFAVLPAISPSESEINVNFLPKAELSQNLN